MTEATMLVNEYVFQNPKDPEGYYHLGSIHLVSGAFALAGESFNQCLALNPSHVDAQMNLGVLAFMLNKFIEAQEIFQSILSMSSQTINMQAANNLALVCAHIGGTDNLELAERTLQYSMLCDSNNMSTYIIASDIYILSNNNIEAAYDVLLKAISINSNSSDIHAKLGQLLINDNRLADGIDYLRSAIDLDPRNFWAHNLLEMAVCAEEDEKRLQQGDQESESRSVDISNSQANAIVVSRVPSRSTSTILDTEMYTSLIKERKEESNKFNTNNSSNSRSSVNSSADRDIANTPSPSSVKATNINPNTNTASNAKHASNESLPPSALQNESSRRHTSYLSSKEDEALYNQFYDLGITSQSNSSQPNPTSAALSTVNTQYEDPVLVPVPLPVPPSTSQAEPTSAGIKPTISAATQKEGTSKNALTRIFGLR